MSANSLLDTLFYPKSVAVIGASSDPTKISGRPIQFLKNSDFDGRIIPINPKSATIQGLPAYRSVADVDGRIDLAICAVPGHLAERVVSDCAEAGVGAMAIFSAGFAELGQEGRDAQQRMAAVARAAGMRLLGPNCMGVANINTGLIASFHPVFAFSDELSKTGRIALVSQSGAFGGLCMQMARKRGVGISHMVTTGNEAEIQAADCLAALATDPAVDVIMLYLEGCNDGTKLRDALELARKNKKPVVAIKLGRTVSGAAAAQSHTAALAGVDAIFDAVFRQYGVYRAKNIEEFFDIGCSLSVGCLPANNKVAIVTVSGGVGVLMADDADDRGLDVAELPRGTQKKFKEIVPFAGVNNPLDVTGQVVTDVTLLEQAMDLVLAEADYGSVVCFQGAISSNRDDADALFQTWSRIKKAYPDVLLVVCGLHTDEFLRKLEAVGIPAPQEPTHGIRTVAASRFFAETFAQPFNRLEARPAETQLPAGILNEVQAMSVLRQAGLTVIDERLATTADQAVTAAKEAGFPVVLKLVSPDVLHKTDIGGVRLNLGDAGAVTEAFADIIAAATQHAPMARIDGCLVAPMVENAGVETIVGMSQDSVFGPVIMFGLGGVLVEALEDVSFRVAPFDEAEAGRMIREIRAFKVLEGMRSAAPSDVESLAKSLSALSHFAASHADELVSVEANPFLARAKGEGVIALDAVIVSKDK